MEAPPALLSAVHETNNEPRPSRYLDWMTVRLGGFRDELLAACTETLLSAPVGLLGGDLGPLIPALKIALTSGASHLPTAAVAVGALERWREETLPLLQPHLAEVRAGGCGSLFAAVSRTGQDLACVVALV